MVNKEYYNVYTHKLDLACGMEKKRSLGEVQKNLRENNSKMRRESKELCVLIDERDTGYARPI